MRCLHGVPVACCPVMSVRILPEFIRGIAYTDENGGLYFGNYAPSVVEFGTLKIKLDTIYPFRDTIYFRINGETADELAVNFRIPEWCNSAELYINDEKINTICIQQTFAVIKRKWNDGDVVKLRLQMKVRISQLNDCDRSKLYPLAFEYGPLLFSLPIPEKWKAYPGRLFTPLPEDWHWYNVYPDNKSSNLDRYDDKGMRKYLITYNVAVNENITPDDVEVILSDAEGYPWENPMVRLKVPAYKALYSYSPYPVRTQEPSCVNSRAFVTDQLEIELVPYGCTNLRITYFPRADLS